MSAPEGYTKVVFASDCIYQDWDTEKECPVCPVCSVDYAECDCPGPTQDDLFEYLEVDGILYAKAIVSNIKNINEK
jgi:hypothetical protein